MTIPNSGFEPAFPQPYPPQAFEKAIVFIDASNLFNRLNELKLRLSSFYRLAAASTGRRQITRVCLYTSEDKLTKAKSVHGDSSLDGCRIVLGASVLKGDGSFREKGVDALLVADLVYHAAAKNCQFASIFTADADFSFALKRVEDFGCKTSVVSVGNQAPALLQNACDEYYYLSREFLLKSGWASEI